MTKSGLAESPEAHFHAVLGHAARLPWVRIDRETYLRKALARYCSDDDIRRAIEDSPAAAGIPRDVLNKAADDSITYETVKVSLISAAAGIPGGLAMLGTVPADMTQSFAHMLRIAQKLAYLYSWPDLFPSSGDEMDDATKGILTLFVGVMVGAQKANLGVKWVADSVSKQVLRKLPQQALTKGIVYPVVKKVAGHVGVAMTKQIYAKRVSQAVPVVGGFLSGGVTFVTYLAMCKTLQRHLASLELTKPHERPI